MRDKNGEGITLVESMKISVVPVLGMFIVRLLSILVFAAVFFLLEQQF